MGNSYKILASAVMMGVAAVANAGVYKGYSQDYTNYETTSDRVADWGSSNALGNISVKDGVLNFSGQTAARAAYLFWGAEAFNSPNAKNNGTDNFYVSFDFLMSVSTENNTAQRSQELAVVSENDVTKAVFSNNAFNQFTGQNDNWLFDLKECSYNGDKLETPYFFVNRADLNEAPDSQIVSPNVWYTYEMVVDTVNRKVEVSILNKETGASVLSAVRSKETGLADSVSILPTGIFVMNSRNGGVWQFDNVVVGKKVEQDVANAPVATLLKINKTFRLYQIMFDPSETLHYKFPAEAEGLIYDAEAAEAKDVEGMMTGASIENEENYLFVGLSTTMEIWTTLGETESDHVTVAIDASLMKLNAPTATIVGVGEGYDKTYQLQTDNSNIPVAVESSISWKYTAEDGEVTSGSVANGGKVQFTKKGVLEMQSVSAAYDYSDLAYESNNTSYSIVDKFDFANMTAEQVNAYGFTESELAGFSDRIINFWGGGHFVAVTGEGESAVYSHITIPNVFVYGVLSSVISGADYKYSFPSSLDTCGIALATTTCNWYIYQYAGLASAYKKGDAADGSVEKTVNISFNYPAGYFAVINWTNNYGRDLGNVDTLAWDGADEAKAVAEHLSKPLDYSSKTNATVQSASGTTFGMTRLSDLITTIVILGTEDAQSDAIKTIDAVKVDDPNAPVYNLRGVKVNKNSLTPGIYIQNGKKFLVK